MSRKWNFEKLTWSLLFLPVLILNQGCFDTATKKSSSSADTTVSAAPPATGGGGVQVPVQADVSGFSLPDGLEVIPPESNIDSYSVSSADALESGQFVLSALDELPTDFDKDKLYIKVSEKSIEQFDIVDHILKALKQTKYEDPLNINSGPYAALIKWEDKHETEMEKWIVDSKMELIDGQNVNIVDVWISDEEEVVKAQFHIYAPATATNRYGIWTLNAAIDRTDLSTNGQFSASASLNAEGKSVIIVKEEGFDNHEHQTVGKLILTDSSGKGVITYPKRIHNPGFEDTFEVVNASYAYNPNHVKMKTGDVPVCKSRHSFTDVYVDYNVYKSDGSNIEKEKKYGYSLVLPSEEGHDRYFWYGAWRGRHGIYGIHEDEEIEIGTIFKETHHDGGDDGVTREYFYAGKYKGYLSKSSSASANIEELKNGMVTSWISEHFIYYYDSEVGFRNCTGYNEWNVCDQFEADAVNVYQYKNNEEQRNHSAIIVHQPNGGQVFVNDTNDGFYLLGQEIDGVSPRIPLIVESGARIEIYTWRPYFVEFDGTDWVQFDSYFNPENQNDWDPVLTNPHPFNFPKSNKEYSLYAGQFEYKVFVGDASQNEITEVTRIMEYAVTPLDEPLLDGIIFQRNENGGELLGTYRFNFTLQALVEIIDDQTEVLVQTHKNKLYSEELDRYFSWNYDQDEDSHTYVHYLRSVSTGEYEILDEPVYFNQVVDAKGIEHGFFGFDGHIIGLPDYYQMIRENDGALPDYEKDHIVNIPEGDYPDLINPNVSYKVKPKYGFRVLDEIDEEEVCQVEIDESLSLDDIPDFIQPTMGEMPTGVLIKIIEGEFL
ncbi:MAG: hypothetical protein HOE90_12270 [Bacteriovoracaceae bacterium]|jgi:hypothetical protein|nr:hypothetical protein [Bacteriovoracaceae bacterium]